MPGKKATIPATQLTPTAQQTIRRGETAAQNGVSVRTVQRRISETRPKPPNAPKK